jgi:phosphoribosylanthranilate isomerase
MITSPGLLFRRKRVIQIAGVWDENEARLLAESGADLIGFPIRVGRPADDADEMTAKGVIRGIHPPCFGVVITYLGKADGVLSLCGSVGVPAVQLHGDIGVEELRRLRGLAPALFLIKALVVHGGDFARLAREIDLFAPFVDSFLADTFDASTGRRGATGKTHDWSVSRRLVEHSPRPMILAGGLTPENVTRAIAEVRPAGVDAHTGLEDASGRKNPDLVKRFVAEARRAFAAL